MQHSAPGMGGPGFGPLRSNLGMPGCPRNWEPWAIHAERPGTRTAKAPLDGPVLDAEGGRLAAWVTMAGCLLAAAAGEAPEPSLPDAQEAAARAAGGSEAQDAARLARARSAHWAPQLRAQGGGREDEKLRAGEYRLAPIREQDVGAGRTWSLMLPWG